MKKLTLGVVLGLLAGLVVARLVWHPASPAPKTEAPADKADVAPDVNPLRLNAERRAAAGITVAPTRTLELVPEIEAFGRVLDPTPYVALVAELATAKASLTASEKELARVQKLFAAGGNASAQAVETAQAAAVRDQAAVASAQIRLLAGWGPALAKHADLATVRDTLEKGAALIRIDLLPGVRLDAPKSASVTLLGGHDAYAVELLGPAPVADAQVQGTSFLALLRNHSLPAGATLHVSLQGDEPPAPALVVPASAIVYHQGSAWVYILDQDTFSRHLVTLGREVDGGFVVTSGLAANAAVATTGAQQLLSAELATGATLDER